jgi:hypothetical protein
MYSVNTLPWSIQHPEFPIQFRFKPAAQLTTTVMGEEVASSREATMRKRRPSAVTT